MSKGQPLNSGAASGYSLGLIPGPDTMDGDWGVDSPNAIKNGPGGLLAWMADAYRPQPIMAAYVDHADDDA
jgi:hypothetical protein